MSEISKPPSSPVVRLSPEQLEREKARTIAMRDNLKRRKVYQQALMAQKQDCENPEDKEESSSEPTSQEEKEI